ncbi:hypothetical protein I5O09_10815 [Pseudomonas parafulva]|uniref:head-tail joining protein n=1 Tax=Pseudomonas parafulva TaxID=157782 RepID=UPI0018D604CD|nr:hypothetical protein [Pseudomonas parafulva]MBH3344237.1 hypothetical protein [Pseudomonas parafulva]
MAFRENVAFMDSALLDVLGDEAEIDGLAEPVPGFFSAPWLQPKLGQINTGLREPTFAVRIMHANDIKEGMHLVIKLAPEDGGGRYVIAARKPDGAGWINLTLREVR